MASKRYKVWVAVKAGKPLIEQLGHWSAGSKRTEYRICTRKSEALGWSDDARRATLILDQKPKGEKRDKRKP